jgi:hypothetical protein
VIAEHRLLNGWAFTFVMAETLRLLIDVIEQGEVTGGDIAGSLASALVLASLLVFGMSWIRTHKHRERTVVFVVIAILSLATFVAARLV